MFVLCSVTQNLSVKKPVNIVDNGRPLESGVVVSIATKKDESQ